jgi:hypothetical protein
MKINGILIKIVESAGSIPNKARKIKVTPVIPPSARLLGILTTANPKPYRQQPKAIITKSKNRIDSSFCIIDLLRRN